jgi:hypothetical protein
VLLPANHPFWEKKIKREHGTCSKIEGELNLLNLQSSFLSCFIKFIMILTHKCGIFYILDLNNMPVQDMLVHLHNDMFSHINQILLNGGPVNPSNEEVNN